ncbi:MAG: rod shape-determining protein RodA [Bacteroidales bacterium]|jgi:rod shape determining protein RodA|nr:rod shape-determining protein RodA [Bacteroidales bacterium]
MREDKGFLKNVDGWLILIYLVLVIAGWFNIHAAVYDENHSSIFDLSQRYGKQMTFIIGALVLALVVLLVDMRFFMNTAYLFYGLSVVLLIVVLLIGTRVSGQQAWIQIGGFSLQPAEIAKFTTCLALAKYLSTSGVILKKLSSKLLSFILIFFPPLLILLQPDTGSALVFAAFILVLYREGLPAWYIWTGFAAATIFMLDLLLPFWVVLIILGIGAGVLIYKNKKTFKNIVSAILLFATAAGFSYGSNYMFDKLESHQQDRINVLIGKEVDLRGVGYNVNQSKIAIGSGGFFGKGYLEGTQTKFNFVPEQATDFIFCTVGEEWGFFGSTVILAVFLVMILRIVFLAERQRNVFARIYGYGVAAILFFHIFVNIGMVIGLLPVIGIPLPFFSYGGSSLWAFTLLLFVFIKQDASRISF